VVSMNVDLRRVKGVGSGGGALWKLYDPVGERVHPWRQAMVNSEW
jgi:hypothetical protein